MKLQILSNSQWRLCWLENRESNTSHPTITTEQLNYWYTSTFSKENVYFFLLLFQNCAPNGRTKRRWIFKKSINIIISLSISYSYNRLLIPCCCYRIILTLDQGPGTKVSLYYIFSSRVITLCRRNAGPLNEKALFDHLTEQSREPMIEWQWRVVVLATTIDLTAITSAGTTTTTTHLREKS